MRIGGILMVGEEMLQGAFLGSLATLAIGLIMVLILFALALYIYSGFAFSAIGKKAKLKSPGLAWIPFVGPAIIAYQASKMHWWPWLLLLGTGIPVLGGVIMLVFTVYVIIWLWKTYEKINKPNWWSLFMLLPIVGLIFAGIAAWGDKKYKN